MRKFTLYLVLFSFLPFFLQGQKNEIQGRPIVTLYANYHAGLGSANDNSGFELDRSYLGYQFRLNEQLGGKVIFDVGPTKSKGAELERVAYVKNAFLSWTPGQFTVDFGLVKTDQFSLQERFWGYRYILKSFDDEYRFGPSADMGIIVRYRFGEHLQADLSLTNGEGYKKINKDNKYRYGAGITFTPSSALVFRIYGDIYNCSDDTSRNQSTVSLFAGYRHPKFRIGAEYNKLFNHRFLEDNDREGCSLYASVDLWKKFTAFGRYDYLHTSEPSYENEGGQRMLVGIQYTPLRYLKFAPNFTSWNPRYGAAAAFLFLNMELKF